MDYLNKYIKRYKNKYMVAFIFITIETLCDLMQPTIMSKVIDKGVATRDISRAIASLYCNEVKFNHILVV